MLFNSTAFLFFLPVVFGLYWWIGARRIGSQNLLLLFASYIFYGWWDYRFLLLIFISSCTDYWIGLALKRPSRPRRRKALLALSLLVNLGILGFFKYYGFFIDSAADLLRAVGLQPNVSSLQIILPVGISFYTFQTLSYTLDIYRGRLQPTRDAIGFFAFVAFFPQLVAGPIERARNLLPQFARTRTFELGAASDGLRQMAWGMLKKVVVADNAAPHVARIFADPGAQDGAVLLIGVFLFAVQIYCDFSGYSDIAIGTARLFGFDLMRNFAFPYFSRDIGEFWRRWHISLSSWFRDYLYIPLGGNRAGTARRLVNILATFTISGLWHGANWTFVFWGFLHGCYYIPLVLRGTHRANTDTVAPGHLIPRPRDLLSMTTTFLLVLLAWVFFRAESMSHAIAYLARMAGGPLWDGALWHGRHAWPLLLGCGVLLVEWIQRDRRHALEIQDLALPARWPVYVAVVLGTLFFGNFGEVAFIYFQF
jgi:D-alanyl-lipoteichoic acid acyltransferase DltB (MBOAT superfamily)